MSVPSMFPVVLYRDKWSGSSRLPAPSFLPAARCPRFRPESVMFDKYHCRIIVSLYLFSHTLFSLSFPAVMRSFLYIPLFGFSFFFTVVLSSSKLKKRDYLHDVFGMTKFGFRCDTTTHIKADLYAVALNGCKAMVKNRIRITCGASLCQTAADRARDISFSEENFRYSFDSFSGPFLLYPILRSLDLYEDGSNLSPGPDRLVMNRNCEIISVITNVAEEDGPPSIRACQSLTSSLTPPSSPARAPASLPQQPVLSLGRLNSLPIQAHGVGT